MSSNRKAKPNEPKFLPLTVLQEFEKPVKSPPRVKSVSCVINSENIATVSVEACDYLGSPVQLLIDWGDGQTEGWNWISDATFQHDYGTGGGFVSFKIRDACCQVVEFECDYESSDEVNIISINCFDGECLAINQQYTYSINATGSNLQYQFIFSDGTDTGFQSNDFVQHTFSGVGNQSVIICVTDGTTKLQTGCTFETADKTLECNEDLNKKYCIISTDLGQYIPFQPTAYDPDDIQSLLMFLCFTDIICPLGFISTTSRAGIPNTPPQAGELVKWIKHFNVDYLSSKGFNYPSEASLLNMVVQGHTSGGAPSAARVNAASNHIVNQLKAHKARFANCPSVPRVWLLSWGPVTDIAQAMWQIANQEDISLADCAGVNFLANWNYTQDPLAASWLMNNAGLFPNTPIIYNNESFRGMDSHANAGYSPQTFVASCITGKGTVGTTPESDVVGNAYPMVFGPPNVAGLPKAHKGGDDPTFLHLLSCALGISNSEDPTDQNSLGGWFTNRAGLPSNYYQDVDYNTNAGNAAIWDRVGSKIQQTYQLYCDCWDRFDL